MKTPKIILLAMLINLGLNTMAQVAINTDGSTPNESAMLDIKSTNKGLLLPRMNTLQIGAIPNPAAGLMVFNIDSSDFYGFNGSKWISLWNINDTLADSYYGDPIVDSRDGQSYNTVQIGTQIWMAENLNYETSNSWWLDNSSANGDIYGRLYTWDAALVACPSGWHLPSDYEWKTLEKYLGMSHSDADAIGSDRGTDEGKKLKHTSGWISDGNGTNEVGFTALPGGNRTSNGAFGNLGDTGFWWSATAYSSLKAWNRYLQHSSITVGRAYYGKTSGYSVRCIKD